MDGAIYLIEEDQERPPNDKPRVISHEITITFRDSARFVKILEKENTRLSVIEDHPKQGLSVLWSGNKNDIQTIQDTATIGSPFIIRGIAEYLITINPAETLYPIYKPDNL